MPSKDFQGSPLVKVRFTTVFPKGHGGEYLTESDISGVNRGAVPAGVGNCGVGVGSTVPLHRVGDGIANVVFTLLAGGLVSPFADLSLELRVDSGSVGHMDRSTGELENDMYQPPRIGDLRGYPQFV